MDLDILIALKDFRTGAGSFLNSFFQKMTFLGELNTVIVIMAIVFWCVSKDLGSYLMMGWSGNRLVNGFLKVTACAYRPWIRNADIQPAPAIKETATGYSFPSGHTMNAATIFGGIIFRKEFSRSVKIIMGVFIALVAFSRNYLSVHTPQDVLVGAAAGILVMWLIRKLMDWVKAHPEKDLLVVLIGIGLAAAVVVYASVKSYPEDYENGKLVVDGAAMAIDTFKGAGYCVAFLVGWILERRFIGFSTDVSLRRKIARLVFGTLFYYIVSLVPVPLLKNWIGGAAGAFISCFLQVFYVSFIFPLFIKICEKPEQQSLPDPS